VVLIDGVENIEVEYVLKVWCIQ